MKKAIQFLPILVILFGVGCQKPCTKTISKRSFGGDTVYTLRTYPNCDDTLNYFQKQVKSDSTIISEGKFVNGQKDGEWKYYGFRKRVTTYKNGFDIGVKSYREDGSLSQEETLNADSLYEIRSYYRNGKVSSESFQNLDGYLTGHGVDYDSLGRKMAEGEYIAEPVLPDTMYIENPDPPYDLQMTIVTENGGKHGPWIYYDVDGNATDTVLFEMGEAIWSGSIVGKWIIDSVATTENSSLGPALFALSMAMGNLLGYEFKPNGKVFSVQELGETQQVGTYQWSTNRRFLYAISTVNDSSHSKIWIQSLTDTRLKILTDNMTVYLIRQ